MKETFTLWAIFKLLRNFALKHRSISHAKSLKEWKFYQRYCFGFSCDWLTSHESKPHCNYQLPPLVGSVYYVLFVSELWKPRTPTCPGTALLHDGDVEWTCSVPGLLVVCLLCNWQTAPYGNIFKILIHIVHSWEEKALCLWSCYNNYHNNASDSWAIIFQIVNNMLQIHQKDFTVKAKRKDFMETNIQENQYLQYTQIYSVCTAACELCRWGKRSGPKWEKTI